MWAHVPNWIVQDREIPELLCGSMLQDHALRASCWSSEVQVLAEPISIRQVPGTSREDNVVERFAPDFFVPPLGTRATVRCRLEVMADHETEDAFGAPGLLRGNWVVRRLGIQHRALSRVPGQERTWTVGNVARVENIERMHRWADEKEHHPITYLLDLQPPT